MSMLQASLFLPRARAEVFPFFAEAANLQRITPPWVDFRIVTPLPIEMRVGALIDYRLSIHGIPIRWRTEITAWDPPYRFVDEQRRGPYAAWTHTHTFREVPGGTLVEDRVEFRAPGGRLVERLFVRRDVRAIFRHRQHATLAAFGVDDRSVVDVQIR
jgi:ligand-binding SRPBCC domain-containing protein